MEYYNHVPLLCDTEVSLFLCAGGVCATVAEQQHQFYGALTSD